MFCAKCGNKSPSGARFCRKCGTKVPGINETVHVPVAPESGMVAEAPSYMAAPVRNVPPPPPIMAPPHITPPPPIAAMPTVQPLPPISSAPSAPSQPLSQPSIAAALNTMPQTPIGEVLNVESPPPPPKRGNENDAGSPRPRTRRAHMAAPTSSGDMDYTFYPGQAAPSPTPPGMKSKDAGEDLEEYPIQPIIPKPLSHIPRVVSDGSYAGYHVPPKLPEPQPASSDVTDFTDYQILPASASYEASYEPAQPQSYEPVQPQYMYEAYAPQPQHVPMPAEPAPSYVPAPLQVPAHMPVPAPMPVPTPMQVAPAPQHIHMQIDPVPPYTPAPVHMEPPPQHVHMQIEPLPQPMPMEPPQAMRMPAEPPPPPQFTPPHEPVHIPQVPAPQIQPYTPPPAKPAQEDWPSQENWPSYDEYGDVYAPRKKSKAPMVISIIIILLIAGGAMFTLYIRSIRVSPSQVVGTWGPTMPIGTWIPQIEFNEDGTGRQFQFNTEHNASRDEIPFEWELVTTGILSSTYMRNSIWPELAEITINRRTRPVRLQYRFESSDIWHTFQRKVYVD